MNHLTLLFGEEDTLQKVTNEDLSPKLYSPESNKAESPKKVSDLDKSAPINSKPNEPNIFSNIQPILWPVSCENSTERSSELSVNSITIQYYEAETEQAPSNITQKDNLLDISITGTDEPTLPTTEIEVLDTVIEVDQFSPSTAQTTERNIPMNLPSTATAQVAEINQDTHIYATYLTSPTFPTKITTKFNKAARVELPRQPVCTAEPSERRRPMKRAESVIDRCNWLRTGLVSM
ncbi:hypothetical protein JTB14_006840 [Gonioctena quinquepunctata]|nr:hypothetical protein JTB14_006840 [Gonioctena quinquepunctata]